MNKIIHGDCLEVLRKCSSDAIDCVVTDPPYGYSFMGKDWDKAVVGVETWKECLRVLKPGGFAFVMSAPRQDVLGKMIVNLTEAGFDTAFTSIYWTYASGFPKAMNIAKAVDKRLGVKGEVIGKGTAGAAFQYGEGSGEGGFGTIKDGTGEATSEWDVRAVASPEAKALDGSYGGFQPKPAVEVILVCMKPLSEKTYVDQALKNGKGVTWLDDARIPTQENLNGGTYAETTETDGKSGSMEGGPLRNVTGREFTQPTGRFPANLLVSDDILNDGKERRRAGNKRETGTSPIGIFPHGGGTNLRDLYGDTGSFSRYFSLDAWSANLPEHVRKTFPFLIVPKASKREKNAGLEHLPEKFVKTMDGGDMGMEGKRTEDPTGSMTRNTHATVKPLTLMSYLITLGSRPGDTVLDPFLGSGTTACAAKALGRGYVGIEREEEYVKIAEARIEASNCP